MANTDALMLSKTLQSFLSERVAELELEMKNHGEITQASFPIVFTKPKFVSYLVSPLRESISKIFYAHGYNASIHLGSQFSNDPNIIVLEVATNREEHPVAKMFASGGILAELPVANVVTTMSTTKNNKGRSVPAAIYKTVEFPVKTLTVSNYVFNTEIRDLYTFADHAFLVEMQKYLSSLKKLEEYLNDYPHEDQVKLIEALKAMQDNNVSRYPGMSPYKGTSARFSGDDLIDPYFRGKFRNAVGALADETGVDMERLVIV